MTHTFKTLLNDEAGFLISAELVLVMTIGVLSMVAGLTAVRDSVVHELNDVSHAIGSISQSYNVTGLEKPDHAWTAGFGFNDSKDECDCHAINLVHVEGKNDPSDGRPESWRCGGRERPDRDFSARELRLPGCFCVKAICCPTC